MPRPIGRLLKAYAGRGHSILFLERDVPWYGGTARDLVDPAFCRLDFYDDLEGLEHYRDEIAGARAVVVGSYVPDGQAVGAFVQRQARGVTAFYDIDTPVTVAALERGACDYLSPDLIPGYDLYLSFTGGPMLDRLARDFGSPGPRALYCCVDPDSYGPRDDPSRWDLSYLGTYSDDRQPVLERLLIEPARRAPQLRFVVAGPQYPASIAWPANVERFEHVGPADHAEFYGLQPLHPQRDAGRYGAGRLEPQRAPVRGRGLRDANHLGPLGRARRHLQARSRYPRGARRRCRAGGPDHDARSRAADVGMAGRACVLADHTAAHGGGWRAGSWSRTR